MTIETVEIAARGMTFATRAAPWRLLAQLDDSPGKLPLFRNRRIIGKAAMMR